MEDRRLVATPEAITNDFQCPIESIDSVSVHLIFNPDEIGHQKWADQHERTCFVRIFRPGDQVGYPMPRAGTRIIPRASTAVDGSYAMPLVITLRKTIEGHFPMTAEKLLVRPQSKGDIDNVKFEEWLSEIVPLELQYRELYG
jgi:hypothetical protein